MSDLVRSMPGTPVIQKLARKINDGELKDTIGTIRYVAILDRKLKEEQTINKNITRKEQDKTEVVTREDIESIMVREMIL